LHFNRCFNFTISPLSNPLPAAFSLTPELRKALFFGKSLYFFYYAAIGAFFAFINVYFQKIGLTGTQIGLVNTVGPLFGILSGTLWGMLIDRTGKTRLFLITAAFGVSAASLAIWRTQAFGWIIVWMSCFYFFHNAIGPIIDGTNLYLLGENSDRYGSQRLWGTISYIVVSSSFGFVIDRIGLHALFFAYPIFMSLLAIAAFWIPDRASRFKQSALSGLGRIIRIPIWILFAVCIVLVYTCYSGVINFLSVAVKMLGGSASLIGVMWGVAAVTELPVFFFGSFLLRRIGARRMLEISIFFFAVRMVLYSIMPSPGWAIGINLLHGLSFSFFWIACVAYATELAPENLKATSQGLLTSLLNISGMVGAFGSGLLVDRTGYSGLFQVLAYGCLATLLIFAAGYRFIQRKKGLARGR
jgi:MFS transporter, PPP family, 3-phenylpropionic acid transporter